MKLGTTKLKKKNQKEFSEAEKTTQKRQTVVLFKHSKRGQEEKGKKSW